MTDRERLIEILKLDSCPSPYLCDENCKYANLERCYEERMADLLLEHGVIVPPCKVGDTVYQFDDIVDVDFCNECESYYVGGMGDYPCCEKTIHGFRHSKCIKIVERVADEDFILCFLKCFGKTVYLTREEAERALKEREDNG